MKPSKGNKTKRVNFKFLAPLAEKVSVSMASGRTIPVARTVLRILLGL